jgi:hypothetical protein
MATEVKRRRGTTVEHSTFTGAVAELTVDLTKDTVVVHDGATQGGFPLLREDFDNVPTTAPFTHITLDTAIFDTTYTETGSETQGTLYWNSDEETISLVTNGESFELGQKTEIHVKNQTGAQIDKGEVVYASGTVGNSGRILITKMIADGTVPAKRIMGITAENIANGADGKIITFGKLKNINTSSFSDGDILYASATTAGALQNTEPSQANGHVSLPIAYVIHAHSNGQIFIRVTPIDENEYQNYDAGLTDIAGLTPTDSNIIVGDGTNWVAESGDTARASLGLTIGTHVQAWDAQLDDIAGLTPTDGNFIVGNGTNFVAESGNTARTSLGLGTSDDVQFDDLTLTGVLRTNEIDTQSDLVWNTSTEVWNTSDYYISGALNIAGSVYITDDLNIAESLTVGTTLDVTGNTTISGTLDAPTLNTGQGDNELYAMNQNVRTSDSVTFDTLSVTNSASVGGSLTLTGSADFNSTMNLQGNLTTQADLADDGFSEGWAGTNWKINADGSAEFEEMRIRGALRVYEFIAKQISTIGGSEILSIAQGRISSVNAGADTITVENVTGTAGNAFKANDLWICQVVDINNDLESGGTGSIVKSVRGTVDYVSGNDIGLFIDSGDITQLEQGDLIIAYGNVSDADRQAIMYRNVDRSEDNLIMRLQTEVNSFADLQAVGNTRVAFGDLNGYSGLSSETFGFFAGKNAEQHVLVTDTGIFFKNGSTVGAQLSSNIFKIGDNDNFLSFNTSNDDFEIKVDTFDLNTSFIQIADSIAKTSSTLTSSVSYSGDLSLDGLFFDAENYFGYLTDVEAVESNGYVFRVGEETSNFIEINSANGIAKINFDTFDLTSGNLSVKSVGTTYPSASSSTAVTTSNQSGFGGGDWTATEISINDKTMVKFYFDYDITTSGELEILLDVSTDNGSTFTNYTDSSTTAVINMSPEYCNGDADSGNGFEISVLSSFNNRVDQLAFNNPSGGRGSRFGRVAVYVYISEVGDADKIRFQVAEINGSLAVCDATNIITQEFQSVTEINPSGVFTRLSDAVILANGEKYLNPELIS